MESMKEKIKYAILGKGKTGKHLVELLSSPSVLNKNDFTVFDSSNKPTLESLQGHDVIISFFPGDVFLEYLPVFIASKIPLVTGSTGFEWPLNLNRELINHGVKWIWSHNFALGMSLVRVVIEKLASAERLFPEIDFKITETHHTLKKDAPSGTAKSWNTWLNENLNKNKNSVEIKSIRHGDVVGVHQLEIDTPYEKITLKHEAKDRKIFAEGALWAANKLLTDDEIDYGLNSFSDIALRELK